MFNSKKSLLTPNILDEWSTGWIDGWLDTLVITLNEVKTFTDRFSCECFLPISAVPSLINIVEAILTLFVVVLSLGKCMVSSFREYLSCRPTEVPEKDILLCESRYIDSEKQMKKFKGLKRFSYSSKVVEDEIYYFRFVGQLCLA